MATKIKLLLLHGLGSSGEDWFFQKEALSPYFEVITPDLPRKGTIAEIAALCAEQLPAYVGGLSFGGCVALQMALDFPEKVKGLILINTTSCMADTNRFLRGFRAVSIRLFPMNIIAKAISWLTFPKKNQKLFRIICEERVSRWSKKEFLALYNELITFDVKERLEELQMPTLILTGGKDLLISPANSTILKEKIPNATQVIIQDAGHVLPVDSADECNCHIKQFISL